MADFDLCEVGFLGALFPCGFFVGTLLFTDLFCYNFVELLKEIWEIRGQTRKMFF